MVVALPDFIVLIVPCNDATLLCSRTCTLYVGLESETVFEIATYCVRVTSHLISEFWAKSSCLSNLVLNVFSQKFRKCLLSSLIKSLDSLLRLMNHAPRECNVRIAHALHLEAACIAPL